MRSRIEALLHYIQILSIAVAIVIIILLGLIYSVQTNTHIELKLEGDIFNLASIFATIWLGLYLAKNINKRDAEQRIEKDILISIVDKISGHLEEVQNIAHGLEHDTDIPLMRCIDLFHSLLQKQNQLDKTCKSCEITTLKEPINQVRKVVGRLKKHITGAPVSGGNIGLPPDAIADLKSDILECEDLLIKLRVQINRH